jgi:N-acetyl-gamma-glutamyl-phosphate reductase
VIDASTAHRVAEGWAYGFAEMDKGQSQKIAASTRVGNPGCWPQGAIATLRPLVEAGLIPADFPATVHGISGYTGGGRAMIADYEAAGENGNEFMPYGLTFNHKHLPELQTYAKLSHAPLFNPAVGNFAQGMVIMVPLQLWTLAKVPSGAELHAAIADHYAAIPGGFVEVAPLIEEERTADLNPELYNNTNRMMLHVYANDAKAQSVLVAVYDNLGKGASGAAVQNLNLMLGVAENTSLAA